jgi:hypothetical protein
MKGPFAVAALAPLMLGGASQSQAEELPAFERDGFPITAHQLQVLGSDGVTEHAPPALRTQDGMPASPHQLQVLRHRTRAAR